MAEGALLFYSKFDEPGEWREGLLAEIPDLDFRVHPDVGDPAEIAYALVWKPPQNFFAPFPNLRLVINLGAGVDSIARRTDLPPVPVMRLSDPDMTAQMVSYVAAAVLRYARDFDVFERDTRARRWVYLHPRRPKDVKVGILGLGELGLPSARALKALGFDVSGWARSPKQLEFPTFAGMEALPAFLAPLDIVVSLVPLTPETEGLVGAAAFAAMKDGAAFVNASRGLVVDEMALAEALGSGKLRGATLDAFVTEPLPEEHPLREIETVLVTPHIASVAGPRGAAPEIAANIRRLAAGEPLLHTVDLSRGY